MLSHQSLLVMALAVLLAAGAVAASSTTEAAQPTPDRTGRRRELSQSAAQSFRHRENQEGTC
jgi:hypothetical protein